MNERLCWEEEPFVLTNVHIIHKIQTFHLSEISWTKSILCSQPHLDWSTRRIKIDLRDEHGCWHDQTSARVERRMLPSASSRRRPITSCKCPFPPLPISVNLFTQFSISKGKISSLEVSENFVTKNVWDSEMMENQNERVPWSWVCVLRLSPHRSVSTHNKQMGAQTSSTNYQIRSLK